MIKVQMLGRLGRDAEVKTLDNGAQVINFSLAHSKKSKDASGNWVESTVWVDCTKWVNTGQTANVAQYMKSGGQVFVSGEPTARAYIPNNETTPRATLGITVYEIELVGGGQQQAGGNAAHQTQQQPQQQTQQFTPQQQNTATGGAFNPDDLPF